VRAAEERFTRACSVIRVCNALRALPPEEPRA